MWTAAQHHEALDVCDRTGAPRPCAAQMATSLVDHAGPSDPEMRRAFERGPIGLVASYVLAGGTLTGQVRPRRSRARRTTTRHVAAGKRLAAESSLADEWDVPAVARRVRATPSSTRRWRSVLFGSSTAAQLGRERRRLGDVRTARRRASWRRFAALAEMEDA